MQRLYAILVAALGLSLSACSGPTSELDPDYVPPPPVDPSTVFATPAGVRIILERATMNGDAQTTDTGLVVRALALDANNVGLPRARIAFRSDTGAIIAQESISDASGFVNATLTTGGDPTPRDITIEAFALGTNVRAATTVKVVPPPADTIPAAIRLVRSATVLAPNATEQDAGVLFRAIVTSASGTLVPNADVAFRLASPNAALRVLNATTDANGSAAAVLTTGGDDTLRTITVIATTGTLSASSAIPVARPEDPSSRVTRLAVRASRATLDHTDSSPANGVIVTAQAVDRDGRVVVEAPVLFSIAGGNGAISQTAVETNQTGEVTATVTTGGDPTPRTITVVARSGSVTGSIDIPVTQPAPPNVQGISLALSRPFLSPTDNAPDRSVLVTAIITDDRGRVLEDVPVAFSLDTAGSAIQSLSGLTDASGAARANVWVTSSTARNVLVRASAGRITQTISIPVRAEPTPADAVSSVVLSSPSAILDPGAVSSDNGLPITAWHWTPTASPYKASTFSSPSKPAMQPSSSPTQRPAITAVPRPSSPPEATQPHAPSPLGQPPQGASAG